MFDKWTRAAVAGAILMLGTASTVYAAEAGRERTSLDAGWRFYRGEPDATAAGVEITNWRWKRDDRGLDSAQEMAAPGLSTEGAAWQDAKPGLDTFHGRHGFSWYRAVLPESPGQNHTLHFESVDDNATVFLNGQKLITHRGWDDPFDVPLDRAWKSGGPNVVAVLVENENGAGGIGTTELQSAEVAVPKAAMPQYDDSSWRGVHLPHDFVVEGSFDKSTGDVSHGFLPKVAGWYRKSFTLPSAYKGRRVWIDFDGVYRNSKVWLNGHLLGTHPSGYTGFRYDITDVANYSGVNSLAVRADSRKSEGWWYEGGGIYRHVWLNAADPLHVAPWGVYANASLPEPGPAGADSADIALKTQLVNASATPAECKLISKVVDDANKTVATVDSAVSVPSGQTLEVAQQTRVLQPHLWSIEKPRLYKVVTEIQRNGRTVDSVETPFGIRTIRFDAANGFFLNGKPVKIKGTCNHQDFAGVGIAMPDSLQIWRIKKLKEMGSNAYRCSHNPPTPELLDACDRLGMLVMDENRHLGDTYSEKTATGTGTSDLSDLADLILRDRNHPSIIMWSMCNEEGLQGSEEGARIFTAMRKVVDRYDVTRPLSCAMNGGWGYGISLVEDLQGCNYNPGGYDDFHRAHPNEPMYGSETASTVSTRGIYANDKEKGYVSAYDVNAPSWAQTAEVAWSAIAERPFVAGGFVWTGFDYKGEPTPYEWPCINSHFGILDECGFPKDNFYYYQAWWGDKPLVHLLPHWNWAGKEGQPISVWAYSNADRVELFLNGKSLGSKDMPRYGHVEWSVPYTPGTLEAKAYKGGALIATDKVETAGQPAGLRLSTDNTSLIADGEEVTMVTVEVVDAEGRVVPTADNMVSFQISGQGHIAGVGNGDPSSHEPDKASERHAFNGLCMAVVQSDEKVGSIQLTASAPGLKSAGITLRSHKR